MLLGEACILKGVSRDVMDNVPSAFGEALVVVAHQAPKSPVVSGVEMEVVCASGKTFVDDFAALEHLLLDRPGCTRH